MKKFNQIIFILWIACTALIFNACMDRVEEFPEASAVESTKDITGSWRIVEAYRNKVDIFNLMDFSKFRINFNADQSYQIENLMPFVVKENGTYKLDDPQYPFLISFKAGDKVEVSTKFDYPIKAGNREIRLSFSPGCSSNTYLYVLWKVDN